MKKPLIAVVSAACLALVLIGGLFVRTAKPPHDRAAAHLNVVVVPSPPEPLHSVNAMHPIAPAAPTSSGHEADQDPPGPYAPGAINYAESGVLPAL